MLDLTDRKFGHLTVLAAQPGCSHASFRCRCECGTEKVFRGCHLLNGRSRSCGCQQGALITQAKTRHGHAKVGKRSRAYGIWCQMRRRCESPQHNRYEYYGARGVRVCERWQTFENFLADMGEPPTAKHQIDRYPDKDGNYEPGNCRWATPKENSNNRRPRRWRKRPQCASQ